MVYNIIEKGDESDERENKDDSNSSTGSYISYRCTTNYIGVCCRKKAPIQQQEAQMGIQPFAQSNLETAVNAALNGPEVKKIKVFEHEFNVKPIEVVNLGGGKTYVKGQISHHLSFRPDDQFYYEFTVKDGEVIDTPVIPY